MSVFESSRTIPLVAPDLEPIAQDVMGHFRQAGFEVQGEQTLARGWLISVHKGGTFKAVLGMKTALNIQIDRVGNCTVVKAGVGIFGRQALPTVIMYFFLWPVLLTQIWGLVQQAHLDDEALNQVEASLARHGGSPSSGAAVGVAGGYCTECGASLAGAKKFCTECGAKLG